MRLLIVFYSIDKISLLTFSLFVSFSFIKDTFLTECNDNSYIIGSPAPVNEYPDYVDDILTLFEASDASHDNPIISLDKKKASKTNCSIIVINTLENIQPVIINDCFLVRNPTLFTNNQASKLIISTNSVMLSASF